MADFKQRIIFEISGEERFNQIKNLLDDTFKRINASSGDAFKNLNVSVDNFLKSLEKIGKADSALGKLPEAFRTNITKVTDILTRQLGGTLQETESRLERLINRFESLQVRRQRAAMRGDEHMVSLYTKLESRLTGDIAETASAATEAHRIGAMLRGAPLVDPTGRARAGGITSAAAAMGGTVASNMLLGGLATSGIGAGFLQSVLPMGLGAVASRALGFGFGPYAVFGAMAGQAVFGTYRRMLPMAEYAGEAVMQHYQMLAGREAMEFDFRRRLVERLGMSAEGLMGGERGTLRSIMTSLSLLERIVTRTVFGGQTMQQTVYQFRRELSDQAIAARPALEFLKKDFTAIETELNPEIRSFGAGTVYDALRDMARRQFAFTGRMEALAPATAFRVINVLGQLGFSPRNLLGYQRLGIGLAPTHLGIDPSLQSFMARRAFGTGFDPATEVRQFFGAAGLIGTETMPARQILSSALTQYMESMGAQFSMGRAGIAQWGAGIAGVQYGISQGLNAAGIRNVSPADTARLAVQVTQQTHARLQTGGDALRRLTMASLMGLGFNMMESLYYLNRDPTNIATQQEMAQILSKRRHMDVTQQDVARQLSAPLNSIMAALSKSTEQFVGEDIRAAAEKIAPGVATPEGKIGTVGAVIMSGGMTTPEHAIARYSAFTNVFNPRLDPGAKAEVSKDTVMDLQNREKADQFNASLTSIAENYGTVLNSISGSSREQVRQLEEINQSLKQIAQAAGVRVSAIDTGNRPLYAVSENTFREAITAYSTSNRMTITPTAMQYLMDINRQYGVGPAQQELLSLQHGDKPTYSSLWETAQKQVEQQAYRESLKRFSEAQPYEPGTYAAGTLHQKVLQQKISDLSQALPSRPTPK